MRTSFIRLDRHGLHIYVSLGFRRNFVLMISLRLQMIAFWRDRPFPRAPQWQIELSHLWLRRSWRRRWKPYRRNNEHEFEGVWVHWDEIVWGSWRLTWGYELPSARRATDLGARHA